MILESWRKGIKVKGMEIALVWHEKTRLSSKDGFFTVAMYSPRHVKHKFPTVKIFGSLSKP